MNKDYDIAIIVIPRMSQSEISDCLPALQKENPVITVQQQSDYDSVAIGCRCSSLYEQTIMNYNKRIIVHEASATDADWGDMRYNELSILSLHELKEFIKNIAAEGDK